MPRKKKNSQRSSNPTDPMAAALTLAKMNQGRLLLPLFLALLWAQLFVALFPTWWEIPTYRYALIAAPLWCLLVIDRFYELWSVESGSERRGSPFLLIGALVSLLPLLLLRPLQQVDQFWRLPLWGHTLSVLWASVFSLIWAFGWPHCRRLVLLNLLALVLIPFPSALESQISGNLTLLVAQGVAALLPLVGYPIDLMGNAMVVKGHILDVSEGCSGLRSFQASLMLGVFLGECYRISPWRRLILLGMAIGLAIMGNGARIFYLATIAYREGPEAEERVHDPAGLMAVTMVYAAIGVTAWALSRGEKCGRVSVTRKKKLP